MNRVPISIHVVSDSLGETGEMVARAAAIRRGMSVPSLNWFKKYWILGEGMARLML